MKTYSCKIDNRWHWSLESACIGVTSPSGRTVWIRKWNLDTIADSDLDVLYQKCVATADDCIVALTYSEMEAVARMAKLKLN